MLWKSKRRRFWSHDAEEFRQVEGRGQKVGSEVIIKQNPGHPGVVESHWKPAVRVLITSKPIDEKRNFDQIEKLGHDFSDEEEEAEKELTTVKY